MLIPVVLLSSVAYIVWYVLLKKTDLPPGPLKLPFIGNIWWFLLQKRRKIRTAVALTETAGKYGDVIHFQLGEQNIVFLQGFDAINDAFVKQVEDFSSRPNSPTEDPQNEGKGIAMENGKPFKIIQSFVMKALNNETASIEEKILAEINAAMEYLHAEKDQPLELRQLYSMMVTNIIYNVTFSKRFDYADDTLIRLIANLAIIFQSGSKLDATAVLPKFIINLVKNAKMEKSKQEGIDAGQWTRELVNKEIEEHEATFNKDKLRDFVDAYINEKMRTAETEIFSENRLYFVIKDLLLAGSEATAVSLNWIILYMQEHPEVQEKCRQEISEKCGDRIIRLADRGSLPFLESTVMEIQRISNAADTSLPHATEKDTSFRGYRIPKDTIVLANLLSSNKDRKYWDDPDTFIPERFLQDKAKRNPAFLPFGLGPRRCTGENLAKKEIFLILTNFLQRFTFQREDPNVRHSFNYMDGQLTATPARYRTRIIKNK